MSDTARSLARVERDDYTTTTFVENNSSNRNSTGAVVNETFQTLEPVEPVEPRKF
jgi:hypothetical protein